MPLAQLALQSPPCSPARQSMSRSPSIPPEWPLDDEAGARAVENKLRARKADAGRSGAGGRSLGFWVWWHSLNLLWLIGALFLLANWPFTLLVMLPVNRLLEATAPGSAGPQTRLLLERWGRLHLIRADLGGTAACLMLVAHYWRI